MIKLDKNLEIEADIETILKRLRVEAIDLGKNIFRDIKYSGDNIQTNCPFHRDSKPSFGINKEGLFHCFSCEESGNLVTLVKQVLDFSTYEAAKQWIIDNYDATLVLTDNLEDLYKGFDYGTEDKSKIKIPEKKEITYVSEEELEKYRYYHPYMYKRGLTDDIIKMFDIGYDPDFKLEKRDRDNNIVKDSNGATLYNHFGPCITFPVRDENGNCLFIARRAINTKFFHYPDTASKPLYGLYEIKKYRPNASEIIVCESMLDALKFWNLSDKAAVALNGVGSAYQIKQLNELPQMDIILCLDSDSAGQRGKRFIASRINNKYVSEYKLPKGRKDANDCSVEELSKLKPELFGV